MYYEYIVEWLDLDYNLHKTKYVPSKAQQLKQNWLEWYDKRQIKSSIRWNVRQILTRYRI